MVFINEIFVRLLGIRNVNLFFEVLRMVFKKIKILLGKKNEIDKYDIGKVLLYK